ncbi:cytochrome P450 [Nocardia sp. BMG51109]|uniref:cytochrome P450 n=1 Tax=Nocardia sp. BMG51109 TaxID=1056816 RepID=UPI0018DEC3DD|nr:cytochrome P450 [Nocardia sp. BMG51109]
MKAIESTPGDRRAGWSGLTRHIITMIRDPAGAGVAETGLVATLSREREKWGLTVDELVSSFVILIAAGTDTVANTLANGMLVLMAHPEKLSALRREPGLIPAAVDETLRYRPPLHAAIPRFAVEPIRIGKRVVGPGRAVLFSLAAANRDPAVFPDPDTFRLRRRNSRPHLGFGNGAHFCLGAHLARLELTTMLRTLAEHTRRIEPAVPIDQLTWRRHHMLHGPVRLPVTVTLA